MYVPAKTEYCQGRFVWMAAVVLVAALGSLAGCLSWTPGAEKNFVKNGILFDTVREMKDGSKLGILARDTVIDGWPVRRDFVVFDQDWRLDELHLSREHERNGILMPAGTRVFPDKQGNPAVCCFPHDLEVQGYLCRGNRNGGFMTAFYPDGKLQWFYTRDSIVVDEVACNNSLFEAIYLHPDGRLRQCQLDKPVLIEGRKYRKGRVIRLDRDGKVLND